MSFISRYCIFAASRRNANAAAILILVSLCGTAHGLAAEPTLALTNGSVTVSGLGSSSEAVLFGITYEPGWYTRIARRDEKVLLDGSGSGALVLQNPQVKAAWAAIDLGSGAVVLAVGEKGGGRLIAPPAELIDSIRRDAGGFSAPGELLEVVLVQPGVGAWSWTGGDNGQTDRDPLEGVLGFRSEDLQPLFGSPPPPKHFLPGSTLVAIDSMTLEIFALQVTR